MHSVDFEAQIDTMDRVRANGYASEHIFKPTESAMRDMVVAGPCSESYSNDVFHHVLRVGSI